MHCTNTHTHTRTKSILIYLFIFSIFIETLSVIDNLCLQYSVKFYLTKNHVYIPLEHIADLVINEVVFGVS